jgi:hypothetical protein
LSKGLLLHQSCLPQLQRPFMGQLNKYITTTVDITHTATTIDIMRIEFIVTVIGIIIEIGRDKLPPVQP